MRCSDGENIVCCRQSFRPTALLTEEYRYVYSISVTLLIFTLFISVCLGCCILITLYVQCEVFTGDRLLVPLCRTGSYCASVTIFKNFEIIQVY